MLSSRLIHLSRFIRLKSLLAASVLLFSPIAFAQSDVPVQTQLLVTSNGTAVSTVPSGSQVMLSATVLINGTPVGLGNIEFCDTTLPQCTSETLVGSASVSMNGTASMSLIPPAGQHNYVAFLTNSAPYPPSSSSLSPVTVTSPSVAVQAVDFSLALAPGSSSAVVLPPETSSTDFNFILTPVGGTTLPPTTLTISNLPSWAQATVTPQTISTGSAKVSVQMALQWNNLATLQKLEFFGRCMAPVTLSLLVLPFAGLMRKSRSRLARVAFALVLTVVGAGAMSGLTGCGSGIHTHTTITATSGAVSHSQTVYYMDAIS